MVVRPRALLIQTLVLTVEPNRTDLIGVYGDTTAF
jgi:hypothetical protein